MRVLLLNSDWSPLNFVSCARGLKLLLTGRAEIISLGEGPSIWDFKYTTPTKTFDAPATIRLTERVTRKYTSPRFRKRVLFNRDNWQCQYCGVKLDWHSITIDHVTPRSRGGTTCWKNCVAACKKCNSKKGSRSLAESGLQLRHLPTEPKIHHFWEFKELAPTWHPDWVYFFGDNNSYKT